MTKPQFNIRALIGLDDSPRSDPAAIAWTDVTQWLRLQDGVSLSSGRQDETAHAGVGLAACAFNNSDGRFTPENTAGAWYPRFKLRRPIRFERCRYDAETILDDAVLWLDANYATSGQTVPNLGTGGTALDARLGSTTGSDSNDPTYLAFDGTPYVYLPGNAGNSLSAASVASIAASSDKFVWVDVELPDWTPAASASRFIGTRGGSASGFEFMIRSGGTWEFQWRDSGTGSWRSRTVAAPGFTDGTRHRVGASIDLDNGAGGVTVRFWESTDLGVTWTQVGADQTAATVAAIAVGSDAIEVGTRASSNDPLVGTVHGAGVFNAIDSAGKPSGSAALTINTSVLTSGSATSLTATTGQTVTINRSTGGRKSVAVVAPVWAFGTDDYMEVADSDLLDFGASDSFTVVAAYRPWATLSTNVARVAKKANTTAATQGWLLGSDGTTGSLPRLQAGDGAAGASATGPARTSGALTITAGVRNVTADTVTTYMNGTAGTPVTDPTTGSLANSEAMRIGRLSGAGTSYSDMELVGVAVFRRALTAAEISAISTYYATREASTVEGLTPFTPLWTGYVEQLVEGWTNGVQPIVRVRAVDAMAFLTRQDSTFRALSVEEIAHDDPALLYPLNDSEGATAAGDQSTSRNATLAVAQAGTGGTAVFGQASRLAADPDEPCLVLTRVDASNGKYLTQTFNPLPALDSLSGVTIETLVYLPVSVPGTVRALELARYGSFDLIAIDLVSDAPRATITIGGTTVTTSAGSAINDGSWHHLAATYDGTNLRLWVDGVNVHTSAAALGVFTGNILTVGATGGAGQLANGWFAGVAAHASALTGARMTARGAIVTGAEGDTSQQRFDRIARLALGAWAESTSTATPSATMCTQPWAGQRPSTLLNQVSDAERAPVHISPAGIPVWQARSERAPSGSPLEIHARQVDSSTGFSTSNFGLVNVAEYTRPGGAKVRISDQASVDDHEKAVDTATIYVDSDEQLTAAANATVNARKTPKRRAGALTVDLVTNAAIADDLLNLGVSDVLRVTDIPSGALTQLDVFLEGWTDTITRDAWTRTWNTSPLRSGGQVWRLGDPVYSKLGVTTILG